MSHRLHSLFRNTSDARVSRTYLSAAKRVPSSGFATLLFALHGCSQVGLFGFDLEGSHHGHYFDDETEGSTARVTQLLRAEPWRKGTSSVSTGIESSHVAASDFVRLQYIPNSSFESHPFQIERGVIMALIRDGCINIAHPMAGPRPHGLATAN